MQVCPVQPNQRYENKRRGPTSNPYVTQVIRDGGRGCHKGLHCILQFSRWEMEIYHLESCNVELHFGAMTSTTSDQSLVYL